MITFKKLLFTGLPLHVVSSLLDPEHSALSLGDAGLLHCLVLCFFPVMGLQELQDPQALQAPSNKKAMCLLDLNLNLKVPIGPTQKTEFKRWQDLFLSKH